MATTERQKVPDCKQPVDYYSPSKLERLARQLGADPGELRAFVRSLIEHRRRERGDRRATLDSTLEARERRKANSR